MKQFLIIMLTAFAVTSCNDDCDHGLDGGGINSDVLVGAWYEETQNEEDVYYASGAFYGKFCNKIYQGEGQGTYKYDPKRNTITVDLKINGYRRTDSWKLRDVTQYYFTEYSPVTILNYGKIVETYNLKGGQTQQINFDKETILGYESTNENIATVSSDGVIYATGEKGTAYIKIKLQKGNVWAKVISSDDNNSGDYADLWIDYSCLVNGSYDDMKEFLGQHDVYKEQAEYTNYSYTTKFHNILKGLAVIINNETHKIDQIALNIKEGVTQDIILSYMKSRYYIIEGDFGNQYHFTTSETIDDSRAVYVYDTASNIVAIYSAENYMKANGLILWPNFDRCFGMNSGQLNEEMNKKGYSVYDSNNAYSSFSLNGSEAFSFGGYDYANIVEFVYNMEGVVSEYIIYHDNSESTYLNVISFLKDKYNMSLDESVSEGPATDRNIVYYNSKRTTKIVQHTFCTVEYIDMTKTQAEKGIRDLGDYWKGLNMNETDLVNTFGTYSSKSNGGINYLLDSKLFEQITFRLDDSGKIWLVNLFLNNHPTTNIVKSYFDSRYTYLETGSNENGNFMKWINASTIEEADILITYFYDAGVVVYQHPSTSLKKLSLDDYINCLGKQKTEIISILKDKGGECSDIGSTLIATVPSDKWVENIYIAFRNVDNTCSSLDIYLDMTAITQEEILNYLKSEFEPSFSFGSIHRFLSKDGRFSSITYDATTESISIK